MHTFDKAIIWCSTTGVLQNSISGFGTVYVNGLNLVPTPPTSITATMFESMSTRHL